ncbi:DUF1302 domain-containing protein [Atopomonas sediminilitoris]|uniref:DUF1302 domain-containing protein n=1 Tax=Atopomonas sediminilitoris TaxID=2919919 RepID=UPI001F4EF8BF|nr:DUF1302 domain-containing protein [Atopomonas sediminilitoris]MCJ8168937.1 DUF1302 domain-containing protein [Atopomonas sediminilitoris]
MEIFARSPLRFAPAKAGYALAGLLPLMVAAQAQAVEFSFADDEVTGSIDTTVSYGTLWRVQGQDRSNNDINVNDGNRNFDTGLVSQVFKITSDAEVRYGDYGAFVRGTAFYDTEIMDSRSDYYTAPGAPSQPSQSYPNDNRFTSETRDKAGHNAEILDAYVYGYWDVFDMPLSARLGKQVFNWGEGVFYRGGVNTTNPVDAAKFRLPGAEIKEVLIPLEAFQFNLGLTDNLSMEAFYQWNWKETAIDPVGTFFSETDLFADGGNTAYYNYAGTSLAAAIPTYSALSNPLAPQNATLRAAGLYGDGANFVYSDNTTIKVADVTSDLNAKDDGQFGFAFRYIAEELNSTEFGAYFVNYHSKEPSIYADLNGYQGVDLAVAASVLGGVNATGLANAGGLATVDALGHMQAKREFAEDIRMYGMSFNTTVGDTSVFGELAYRPNLPVGISATNDLLGDLTAQAAKLVNTNAALAGFGLYGPIQIAGNSITLNDSVSNYTRVEAFNSSLGAIHNFGPVMSFDSFFGVAELASEHLRGDSLQYTANDGSTRYYAGRPNGAYRSGYDRDDQVNKNAYGYTLLVNGTWNDVYAGVNLSPFAVYKNDFEGNSHQTGNFIEGREAYTLGMRASYLNALEAELAYTEFFGGGQNNASRDRDNIGLNVKYSF